MGQGRVKGKQPRGWSVTVRPVASQGHACDQQTRTCMTRGWVGTRARPDLVKVNSLNTTLTQPPGPARLSFCPALAVMDGEAANGLDADENESPYSRSLVKVLISPIRGRGFINSLNLLSIQRLSVGNELHAGGGGRCLQQHMLLLLGDCYCAFASVRLTPRDGSE
ncbi:hypothetical protein HaLaN_00817 [Haematococcus lacustris]|uniref:Uncharacterized protein n=1 Tax=Haematococcus lacustris TaxID=44745 RepID=A0A699YA61_HAELA|nr:hypothetical protein HaLaN_00817 [Haematococcus lacustris]